MPNVALDILVNVVRIKILLIFILLPSLVFIFVLVLVSSTIIQNVFVIFVIVFVVVDGNNTGDDVYHPACTGIQERVKRQFLGLLEQLRWVCEDCRIAARHTVWSN